MVQYAQNKAVRNEQSFLFIINGVFIRWFKKTFNFAIQSTLVMNEKHQEDLSHIRSMMERSSRFISLSGLSGVFAGFTALLGGIYVYLLFKENGIDYFDGTSKMY